MTASTPTPDEALAAVVADAIQDLSYAGKQLPPGSSRYYARAVLAALAPELARVRREGAAEALAWDLRGGALWLDREQWGVVIDALIQHADSADARKAGNSESTSDVRADMCRGLIRFINRAAEVESPQGGGE